ncbi:MAG: PRC-barrel domain-containing protein [Eggerthellaceae bacterium]|jgi:sporulation protein YlmC with PRC-barrel domain
MLTVSQLMNDKVIVPRGRKQKERRIGKVRRFVFHPREKRCIGFIIKRPDAALMFKRKDLFVALDRIKIIDDEIHVDGAEDSMGGRAVKRLGVKWEECVLWMGMQVVAENGEILGTVGDVAFDGKTGRVDSIELDNGATARALLGKATVPASYIKGFRFGVGSRLSGYQDEVADDEDDEDAEELEEEDLGAILVSNEALALEPEGGLAEKAGRASVVAKVKGREAVEKAKVVGADVAEKARAKTAESAAKAKDQVEDAKPQMKETGKKAEEALNKGAYFTGVQIAKSKKMFAGFMDNYRKAVNGEDEDDN